MADTSARKLTPSSWYKSSIGSIFELAELSLKSGAIR